MNHFDDMHVDLPTLYATVVAGPQSIKKPRFVLFNRIRYALRGAMLISKLHRKLVYSNITTGWMDEFSRFWRHRLDGRPIDVVDFQYLRLAYRSRFQHVEHTDETSSDAYIDAWQQDANLYLLFGAVWTQAKDGNMSFHKALSYLPHSGAILEYGAGAAPITTGLLKYFGHRKYQFTIADILQISFVYALDQVGAHVEHLLLTPFENQIKKKEALAAIFCMTVMEHLPNPLEVVRSFHNSLKPNGLLFFDYIMADGEGLDARGAVDQRDATIKFLGEHFKILKGSLRTEASMDFTVAQKN